MFSKITKWFKDLINKPRDKYFEAHVIAITYIIDKVYKRDDSMIDAAMFQLLGIFSDKTIKEISSYLDYYLRDAYLPIEHRMRLRRYKDILSKDECYAVVGSCIDFCGDSSLSKEEHDAITGICNVLIDKNDPDLCYLFSW